MLCLIVFGCQYQCNWLPGKTCLQNDLLFVEWDVKPYTLTHYAHKYGRGQILHTVNWHFTDGCRQAKMFLKDPDKQLSCFALGIKRKQLRVLVGVLTGHIALNRHLSVVKIWSDPLCPACGEEEETSYHLLAKFAYMVFKYFIMGAHTMEHEELGKVRPTTFLSFTRATKRISWPLVVLGLHNGPNVHGLR